MADFSPVAAPDLPRQSAACRVLVTLLEADGPLSAKEVEEATKLREVARYVLPLLIRMGKIVEVKNDGQPTRYRAKQHSRDASVVSNKEN